MEIKIKKKYIIIMVLILLAGVITTTFAYFGAEIIGTATGSSQISSGTFNMTLSDTTLNMTDFAPIYDVDYKTQAFHKTFTITADSSSTINVCSKLYLDISTISDALKSRYFKYRIVTSDDYVFEGTFEDANTTDNYLILNSLFFEPGDTRTYDLYIWYSYRADVDQSAVQNSNFSGVLVSEGVDTKLDTSCDRIDLLVKSVTVDGTLSNTPTSGNYYLTNASSCTNGATLEWNNTNSRLSVDKYIRGTQCTVVLKSNPYLYEMPLGSYVSYTGDNGCPTTEVTGTGAATSSNSCIGNNANQSVDSNSNSYGYCYSPTQKILTYGWRLAYTYDSDSDNILEPYIISAGSPECNTGSADVFNTLAMKYCNSVFSYKINGLDSCQTTFSSLTANAWNFNDSDFQRMTYQLFGESKTLSSCLSTNSKECGYYNLMIDTGGTYKFSTLYNTTYTYYWSPSDRFISYTNSTSAYGLRPVIHLKPNIHIVGGNGTMTDPYLISQ